MLQHPLRYWFVECLWLVLIVTTAWGAFTWNQEQVFYRENVYFVDGDCYARMTRVRDLYLSGIRPIRHHIFENHPNGVVPHTTLPFDALIYWAAKAASGFSSKPLEVAGAWISPLLGVALVGLMGVWTAARRWPYRHAMTTILAISPILAHGFQVGRPDHQSLLVLLVGIALAAELTSWHQRKMCWAYCAAAAWALSLWVSLFEPLVIFAVVLVAKSMEWLIAKKHGDHSRFFSLGPSCLFGAILVFAFIIDGRTPEALDPAFANWAANIGELRSPGWSTMFSWAGWLFPLIPILLCWKAVRRGGIVNGFLGGLTALLLVLTSIHARWGYFLALAVAISLPFAFTGFRRPVVAYALFAVSLWPIASAWESTLFPSQQLITSRTEQLADAVALRDVAIILINLPDGGVVAPWWFSPAVVWWSGKPCVAGTSHQSLPGILDTCRVYLAKSPLEAVAILEKRDALYVISYEPERVVSNASQVMNSRANQKPLVATLYTTPHAFTDVFEPLYANRFFKLHRAKFPGLAKPK